MTGRNGPHQGRTESGLTRCSIPSVRESMIQAIWSSVPKVAAAQMKLNFLPSRIRICGRPNCTVGLINDLSRIQIGTKSSLPPRCTAKCTRDEMAAGSRARRS